MQWPDAIAGALGAAEDEARQSRVDALDMVGSGAGSTIAALFSSVAVPSGLDLPCTEDPELFFAEAPEDVETAKALCQGCRARATCLEGALERREPWGVWGGELLLRGTIVPRKRPRGRPRKEDAGIAKAAGGQAALRPPGRA
jgi:WhiB family transcriptional regulator, redox-sensing transcriptional regulator